MRLTVDLTGPDGNAFALLGMAKRWCNSLDLDYIEVSDRMMSGDYDNLVEVFEEVFGDFVEIER